MVATTRSVSAEPDHELRYTSVEGDTRLSWDPAKADEVTAARRTFDDLRAKGFRAYRMDTLGTKGEPLTTFDPQTQRIIMVAPLAGG